MPAQVHLSATRLHDYLECHRLFQLKHLLMQPWPSVGLESIRDRELHLKRGKEFHHLVERYYLGIDENILVNSISDDVVRAWWRVYRDRSPVSHNVRALMPEHSVQAVIEGCLVTAVFDLVVIGHDRQLLIVDWKTSQKRPNAAYWQNHIQTQLYLYMAVEASAALAGEPLNPEQVRLVYWFVQYPDDSLTITYDRNQHLAAHERLSGLIREVYARSVNDVTEWQKTSNLNRCAWCVYNSLCDRKITPDFSEDDEFNLDDFLVGEDVE